MLFRASVSPIDTTSSTELTWESSNPNVASVDQEGMAYCSFYRSNND